jgi:hypothetical protein
VKPNLVSIVIPVYNEQHAIGDDLDLIIQTMEAEGNTFVRRAQADGILLFHRSGPVWESQ